MGSLRWKEGTVLVFILLTGWIIRGLAMFHTDLIPAVNGAYYLVQARSILRTGWLGIPDFPLLFYIQAILGKVLSFFMPFDCALLTGVRLTDTVFPVLCAIPVFLYSRTFNAGRESSRRAIWAMLLTGLLAVGCGSLLRMIGDFQKNSFALPLFLFYTYYLYESFRKPQWKNYIYSLLFFSLVCLTHLGVAAMTFAFTACFLLIHSMTRSNCKRIAVTGLFLAGLSILALWSVSFYDPVRVGRLAFTALNPFRMFSQSILFQVFRAAGSPPNEMGGLLLGNVLGILGMIVVLGNQSEIDANTRTLLFSGSLCALFLASPLIHADLSSRFGLMAYIPGLIPFAYFVLYHRRGVILGSIITTAALAHTIAFSFQIQPTLSKPAYDELVGFKSALPAGKNLILTKHGLEWWVAWTMETQIARNPQIVLTAWDRYDAAFEIVEIASGPNDFMTPPAPPGSLHKEPPQDRPPRNGVPPNRPPGDGQPPPGSQPGMTPFFNNPNQKPPVPPDPDSTPVFQTTLVREGQYFQLFRLNREKREERK